jgi:hypothetical protein
VNESLRLGILIGFFGGSVITAVVMAVCHQAKKQMATRKTRKRSAGHPAFFRTQQIK